MTTTTKQIPRPLPDVGSFLTDGERLVEVIEKNQIGIRVEDCAHPEQEFVILRGRLGRWRTVDLQEIA